MRWIVGATAVVVIYAVICFCALRLGSQMERAQELAERERARREVANV